MTFGQKNVLSSFTLYLQVAFIGCDPHLCRIVLTLATVLNIHDPIFVPWLHTCLSRYIIVTLSLPSCMSLCVKTAGAHIDRMIHDTFPFHKQILCASGALHIAWRFKSCADRMGRILFGKACTKVRHCHSPNSCCQSLNLEMRDA
jgi:hypothetical protein